MALLRAPTRGSGTAPLHPGGFGSPPRGWLMRSSPPAPWGDWALAYFSCQQRLQIEGSFGEHCADLNVSTQGADVLRQGAEQQISALAIACLVPLLLLEAQRAWKGQACVCC